MAEDVTDGQLLTRLAAGDAGEFMALIAWENAKPAVSENQSEKRFSFGWIFRSVLSIFLTRSF